MNARDLSEPPNGTTSGCPPPSLDHNYRGLLHKQQMNRSEPPGSAPFPKGVAQITRDRDRSFFLNICLYWVFLISQFETRIDVAGTAAKPLSLPDASSNRIETPDRRIRIEQFRASSCALPTL